MRYLLITLGALLAAALMLGAAAARADEDCPIHVGDYFDSDPGPAVAPAIALKVDRDQCIIDGRVLPRPGEAFDPYVSSFMGDFVSPLVGPPPYDHPYGCPYQAGDSVDFADDKGTWHPAVIDDSDETCAYKVTAFFDKLPQAESVDPYAAADSLRPGKLKGPSQDDIAAARLCPPGGAAEDFADDSEDSMFKHAIIADLSERENDAVHVYFNAIKFGTVQPVTGRFIGDHPDAPVGGEIYPFRLNASVCKELPDGPDTTRHQYDFNCYDDKFGDFVCRMETDRPQ